MKVQVKEVKTKKAQKKDLKTAGFTVALLNMKGEKVGDATLPSLFKEKPNPTLLAQAVRVYLSNQRGHGAETKTRAQVRGGGAKPWRQKGTGRARAGSIRSPLWRGGGITHGPHPRDFGLEMPKKMKKKALSVALSEKAREGSVIVLSKLEFAEPKTKLAEKLVKTLPLKEKVFIVASSNENLKRTFQNLKKVDLTTAESLNTYQVLVHDSLVFTKESLEILEGLFKKNE